MPRKTFEEVLTRFREIPIPEDFDLLVAIANGGIIPAAPLNLRLTKEVRPLRICATNASGRNTTNRKRLVPVDFDVKGNADYALYNEACFRFPGIL